MKYQNEEVKNINNVAKRIILKHMYYFLSDTINKEFGGLDIRSKIAKEILKQEQGFDCSVYEAEVLMKTLNFEMANVIGKLENQCLHPEEHTVPRNNQGHIAKQSFGL